MAPISLPLPPRGPHPPLGAAPAGPRAKPPVDADIRVCLDFIKGRCTRPRCKFYHPEMAGYQQLSGVVQAQAGRQICEVWAMTGGQCKFGAKCNKIHPVVITQPTQALMAIPVPTPLPTAPIMAAASPPRPHVLPAGAQRPPQPSAPLPARHPAPQWSTSPAPVEAVPPQKRSPALPAEAEGDFGALAQAILHALQECEDEPPTPRAGKDGALCPPGVDRIMLDILSDLHLVAC